MVSILYLVIGVVAACLIGVVLGNLLREKLDKSKVEAVELRTSSLVREAQKEAEAIKKEAELEARDMAYQAKAQFEREWEEKRKEILALEKRLVAREEQLGQKMENLEKREGEIARRERSQGDREKNLADKERKAQALLEEQKARLESLAGVSSAEAKKLLMEAMEEQARADAARTIRQVEEEAREEADKRAKNILAQAMQKYAGDVVTEGTVSVVQLPNEEMKGRIIGREGRNIRAIEAATGMDLIIDDTPEAVILSGFSPLRREIARIALERLIKDGRIHPARVEEVVEKVSQEMEVTIRETGEKVAFDVGIHGLHPELIKLLGRLRFRSSYGQNCLTHSQEVAFLCGIMAAELGVNVKQAKRAGLLHDIGKAVDHEVEGSHDSIGAQLARKYGESPKIVHAIAAHHEEEKPETVIAVLVSVADALSAARPGARREMYETYIQRVKDLERIATSFKGVGKAYAIHAGREVRVIVEPVDISDAESHFLARDVAKKIEAELSFPGQIKVTVVRESRAVEYAR